VLTTFLDLAPFVEPERVLFVAGKPDKRELLSRLGEALAHHPAVHDSASLLASIFDRESVTSTGVGDGVAVPHAQSPGVSAFAIALAICPAGVDFNAKDGKPVRLVVMIAAPEGNRAAYLKILASVASRLNDPAIRQSLLEAPDAATAVAAFLSAHPGA
jgi:mannitol/fructose-specific phosphotransferase system IIA component (Ntr-type)